MQPSPIQHSISSTCLPFGLCHNHLHTRQLHKPLPSPLCPFTLQGVFFPPMDIQFLMLSLSHYSGKETNYIVRAAITVSCRQNWIQVLIIFAAHTFRVILHSFASPMMVFTTSYQSTTSASSAADHSFDQQVLSNDYMPGDSQVAQW